ncbi:MAG: PD-(D/E)XK nuclease family protein, partial [Geminicoccaceae bacterium]
ELVARALRGVAETASLELNLGESFAGGGLRLRRGVAVGEPDAADEQTPLPAPLPSWARTAVRPEPAPMPMLAPSRGEDEAEPVPGAGTGAVYATRFQRGLLIHRLIQFLPDLAAADRAVAGGRLLQGLAPELATADRDELVRQVVDLLARAEFGAVFAAGSRAEQPICGVVAGRAILGQIDRLVVTEREILLVDCKSNRTPPATVDRAPLAYLRQLAAYRALLMQIYPDRPVRAALLWTEAPRLDEVPPHLLDRYAPHADPAA